MGRKLGVVPFREEDLVGHRVSSYSFDAVWRDKYGKDGIDVTRVATGGGAGKEPPSTGDYPPRSP